MPKITLPDGSVREYPDPVSGLDVAASIGQRLAKDALGVVVDGELRDLSFVIQNDAKVAIVTPKNRDGTVNKDALFLMRHSAAHVMADARTGDGLRSGGHRQPPSGAARCLHEVG